MTRRASKKGQSDELRILSIDIGGTGLKASVVDSSGHLLVPRCHIDTPYPCRSEIMLDALAELVAPLPQHNRIAIGFAVMVRGDKIVRRRILEQNNGRDFRLPRQPPDVSAGRHARSTMRDAGFRRHSRQGIGARHGRRHGPVPRRRPDAASGTGAHPIHGKKTYNDYIEDAALRKVGKKHWNKRMVRTVVILADPLHFDHLFIGGGNTPKLALPVSPSITIISNDAGIEGGAGLWRSDLQALSR